ncbi:hypothetical protein D3C84_1233060 [compost metagenome]
MKHLPCVLDRAQLKHLVVGITQRIRDTMHARLQQVDAALHGDQVQLIDFPCDGISA